MTLKKSTLEPNFFSCKIDIMSIAGLQRFSWGLNGIECESSWLGAWITIGMAQELLLLFAWTQPPMRSMNGLNKVKHLWTFPWVLPVKTVIRFQSIQIKYLKFGTPPAPSSASSPGKPTQWLVISGYWIKAPSSYKVFSFINSLHNRQPRQRSISKIKSLSVMFAPGCLSRSIRSLLKSWSVQDIRGSQTKYFCHVGCIRLVNHALCAHSLCVRKLL